MVMDNRLVIPEGREEEEDGVRSVQYVMIGRNLTMGYEHTMLYCCVVDLNLAGFHLSYHQKKL